MIICVPTTSDDGATARVAALFDEAPYYTLVGLGGTAARAFPNVWPRDGDRWDAASCLDGRAVDAVICRGISPTVLGQLRAHGIAVLATDAWTVAGAVRAFREARVSRFTTASTRQQMVVGTR
jgi:predicted Fe-Mo cluster-binding NifX family protein